MKKKEEFIKRIYPQIVDTTKIFTCKLCGYTETDTEEWRAFHASPDHEVRVHENYIGEGEYDYVVLASTRTKR